MLLRREHSLQSGNPNDGTLTGMNIKQYVLSLTKKSRNLPIFRKKKGFTF